MNVLQWSDAYKIENVQDALSPSLVIFYEHLTANLHEMIRTAGHADRLCPHCKTHKTREIVQMMSEFGIQHHKCATIAEAEMLATVGAKEVLIAYQLVGPNLSRFRQLVDKYPKTRFACLVDNARSVQELGTALHGAGQPVGVLVDLDSGMHRTGIPIGQQAIELFEMVETTDGVQVDGLHWYDGHHRQDDAAVRRAAVDAGWNQLTRFRDQLLMSGLPVKRIVAGGSGSFSILAEKPEPNLLLSPGTTVFWDADMLQRFPELNFKPALAILTRVISANRSGQITLDVGHKSCAADQPAGNRLAFPGFPDARESCHTEEHLVLETSNAADLQIGDVLLAIPRHVCPCVAVHQSAYVVKDGKIQEQWKIAARDRVLTL